MIFRLQRIINHQNPLQKNQYTLQNHRDFTDSSPIWCNIPPLSPNFYETSHFNKHNLHNYLHIIQITIVSANKINVISFEMYLIHLKAIQLPRIYSYRPLEKTKSPLKWRKNFLLMIFANHNLSHFKVNKSSANIQS